MSRADFAGFVTKLNADESLRSALRERLGEAGTTIPAGDLIAFAREHGYTFDLEDARNELSEADLNNVAGGIVRSPRAFDGLSSDYDLYLKEGDLNNFYVRPLPAW